MSDSRPLDRDTCPIDAQTREWIDARASWLIDQFGRQRIATCPMVLPTVEFFPPDFQETEEDARALLDRICEFLGVGPDRVELSFYFEGERLDTGSTSAGLYEGNQDETRIWIEVTLLRDPLAMAAVMAHELGHVLLLGQGRISETEDDHEPLTDLLTVFLGLGVITANAALSEENRRGGDWFTWKVGRRGYLSMAMYGYALALFSKVRADDHAAWSKHLRADVRHCFNKSMDFFQEFGIPELRSVKTTSARPVLNEYRKPLADEEYLPEIAQDEEDAATICRFCAAPLTGTCIDEVCEECQASIDEHAQEFAEERRAADDASARRQIWLRWIFWLGLAFLVAVALLEMFARRY